MQFFMTKGKSDSKGLQRRGINGPQESYGIIDGQKKWEVPFAGISRGIRIWSGRYARYQFCDFIAWASASLFMA
jgi:hypothetical protein